MSKEELKRVLEKHTMTPSQVVKELSINAMVLSRLRAKGTLVPIFDRIYAREEVLSIKEEMAKAKAEKQKSVSKEKEAKNT